jgi:trehalose synthase
MLTLVNWMPGLEHVPVAAMDPHRFRSVISDDEYAALLELITRSAETLRGRVIWNVSSTARGGGVAELLRPLLGYSRGAGVDARWVVISGGPEFFAVTKRLHNHLHGFNGDGGSLSMHERGVYELTLAVNAAELVRLVSSQDVVILHDPQTAGLVDAVRAVGATVIWRCHIGLDRPNRFAREAWDFQRPYVVNADAYVFSRPTFAWEGLDPAKVSVIHPSIDVFSPKNAEQTRRQRTLILARAGIVPQHLNGHATFTRSDGTPGRIDRAAHMLETAPLTATDRLVVQISRWDRLKDPIGVAQGFVEHVAPRSGAHLVLAGPTTDAVADDPEGAAMYAAVRDFWHGLPSPARRQVHLAALPMADIEENAAIVNALQRQADVIVQKSLAEGFGLTVSEAMWKRRPVVASRIGGIQDQIVDGESGFLVSDPRDLREYGSAVARLLDEPEQARRIGAAAHARVSRHFLGPQHLGSYFELIHGLLAARNSGDRPASASTPGQGAAQPPVSALPR